MKLENLSKYTKYTFPGLSKNPLVHAIEIIMGLFLPICIASFVLLDWHSKKIGGEAFLFSKRVLGEYPLFKSESPDIKVTATDWYINASLRFILLLTIVPVMIAIVYFPIRYYFIPIIRQNFFKDKNQL